MLLLETVLYEERVALPLALAGACDKREQRRYGERVASCV